MEQAKSFKIWPKMGYIFGRSVFAAANSMFIPVYLLYYFTEVFGLNIAVAGAMTALVRIIGSASQVLSGYLIDHTHSKHGQARPYLLAGIPVSILIFLLYYSPNLTGDMKTVYAYTVYILFALSAALYGAANSLMMPRITDNTEERNKIVSVYGTLLGAFSFILTVWCTPIVTYMGGGDLSTGFTVFAAIIGGVILISTLFALRVKEQVVITPQKINLRSDLLAAIKNKYGFLYAGAVILLTTGINLVGALLAYAATYVVGNPGSIGIIYACVFGVYPILSALYVPILKRINKPQMFILFAVLTIGGCILRMIFPSNLILCIVGICVMVMIDNTLMCYGSVMVSEAADYVELHHSLRSESTFNSLFSLIGSLIYSGVLAYATNHLNASGYVSKAETQVPAAIAALNFWVTVPLLIACVVCVIFMIPLSKYAKQYPALKAELLEKRAERAAAKESAGVAD